MLTVVIMNYIRIELIHKIRMTTIYQRFTVSKSSSKHLCNKYNPFMKTIRSTNHITSKSNNNWCDQVRPKSTIKGKPLHSPLLTSTAWIWQVKRALQPLHCLATLHTAPGLPHLLLIRCDTRCIHIIANIQSMHSKLNNGQQTIRSIHDDCTKQTDYLLW